jgi:hypothetical protein
MKSLLLAFIGSTVLSSMAAGQTSPWPAQALPKGIVRTVPEGQFPAPKMGSRMLVQSLAGLAAKAVNEGRGDELVWVSGGNVDVETWYGKFMAAHPDVTDRGSYGPWDLVDRYTKLGLIKGYILYRLDHSDRKTEKYAPDIDISVNVATSLSGILDGIIIDESMEAEAKRHGLTLLMDARGKTDKWCFETYRDQFNRRMLFTQDPTKVTARDYAIAHKALALFGYNESNEPGREVMEWLEPLSPIVGWNGGDEQKTTKLSTIYGNFQTCTDWSFNLPVLMAGADGQPSRKPPLFDPSTIDWNDHRSGVSYVLSDGDNIQWWQTTFFHNSAGGFWDTPDRGKIPFGWSCPFSNLAEVSPQPMNLAIDTRTPNDWFLEWGGGYFYPDFFAMARPDRWDLLAKETDRIWQAMKQTGTQIVAFNMIHADSPDALKAYEVMAGETDGLLAIFVFQYNPYEGGQGKVFWVKDKRGLDVPVITCRYSIWYHKAKAPLAGTPAKVARLIKDTVASTPAENLPRYDWIICHAWSYFKQTPGNDEAAEDLDIDTGKAEGGVRGYSPAYWSAQRLPQDIRVISPPELAWRIRMQHDPEQTKQLLQMTASQTASP